MTCKSHFLAIASASVDLPLLDGPKTQMRREARRRLQVWTVSLPVVRAQTVVQEPVPDPMGRGLTGLGEFHGVGQARLGGQLLAAQVQPIDDGRITRGRRRPAMGAPGSVKGGVDTVGLAGRRTQPSGADRIG